MIFGIGNDIIEVSRIEKAIETHGKRFLDRIFTQYEQEYCDKRKERYRHYAGRFAAKEAVVKALGTGFREEIVWSDIEIINDHYGKPEVNLSATLRERFSEDVEVLLSISHSKDYATAVALLQKK